MFAARRSTGFAVIAAALLLFSGIAQAAPKGRDVFLQCLDGGGDYKQCCLDSGGTVVDREWVDDDGHTHRTTSCEFPEDERSSADALSTIGVARGSLLAEDPADGGDADDPRTVHLAIFAQDGRRLAGKVFVDDADPFDVEGTVAASGRVSLVRRGTRNVVATGRVDDLGGGAYVIDGVMRHRIDEGDAEPEHALHKGPIVALRALDFDPDDPPSTRIPGRYEGGFTDGSGGGGAVLELDARDTSSSLIDRLAISRTDGVVRIASENPASFACRVALTDASQEEQEEEEMPPPDADRFTGECSADGDGRVVGALLGVVDDQAAVLTVDGGFSTEASPPRDDDVAPAPRDRIDVEYRLRLADGTEQSGVIAAASG